MFWQRPRDDCDQVISPIQRLILRIALRPGFTGPGDALPGLGRYSVLRGIQSLALFDFNEGENGPAPCDQVDLADGKANALGEDGIALHL